MVVTKEGTKLSEGQFVKIYSTGPSGCCKGIGFGVVEENDKVRGRDRAVADMFVNKGENRGNMSTEQGYYTSVEITGISNAEAISIIEAHSAVGKPYSPVPHLFPGTANSNTQPMGAYREMMRRGYKAKNGGGVDFITARKLTIPDNVGFNGGRF